MENNNKSEQFYRIYFDGLVKGKICRDFYCFHSACYFYISLQRRGYVSDFYVVNGERMLPLFNHRSLFRHFCGLKNIMVTASVSELRKIAKATDLLKK